MKLKFFVTIFLVVLATSVSISAIHYHFFRAERHRLIEINLQQNATLLANSDINLTKKEFQQTGEEFINDIIGNDKINMIISIYQENGELLYENDNAPIFHAPKKLTHFTEWEDVETKDYYIKYLTVRDKEQHRFIRVGMIQNQSLLRWKYLNKRLFVFAGIILFVSLLISWFLTNLLFRPVQALAQTVNVMTSKLESGETTDFQHLMNHSAKQNPKDEFQLLLQSVARLSQKINESHNITKRWSALMAHELKTPLTILKNRIESLYDLDIPKEKIGSVDEEMTRLEKIIVNFLDWATFESDPARPEIHAVSLKKHGDYLLSSLRSIFPDSSIEFIYHPKFDVKVFCNPIHFDQMISNLVTNAVKYGKGKVTIECDENYISVRDEGEGVPGEVISRIGTPFNHFRSGDTKGSGLGLAWVSTICRKYGWFLQIDEHQKNQVKILFPASA